MRFATDTGGTFTDLVVEDDEGLLRMYKAPTVPTDPVKGVLDALEIAAAQTKVPLSRFLAGATMFIHGTTHALNAIVTGRAAKTALLCTGGHRDVLVLREGGRMEPFNFTVPYPKPYIPRRLTFEVSERIDSRGRVVIPLDEAQLREVVDQLRSHRIEAVGVCLLWSMLNPTHERRIGDMLRRELPEVKVTLSHLLNPTIREYPRAISTCIDASLKPMMQHYLGALEERLRSAGFRGRVLVLTSQAGMRDAAHLADTPIHAINSGPSTAPVAGRFYAKVDSSLRDAIVADTGGTTYDVSLVRDGHIPFTKESWLGQPFRSDITGFPSVDLKSVGAGGGSIAWIDEGGVLHVGPDSAGAVPGPACYGRGGERPTLTDACVVLGYLDPEFFLDGAMRLDAARARQVLEGLANSLNMSSQEAALAIVKVATENMVQAIAEMTINRGIDPTHAVLVGGGGAAGLNSVLIARRLGCPLLTIPAAGAALSAAGALMSDLSAEFRRMHFTTSGSFEYEAVNKVVAELLCHCEEFGSGHGADALTRSVELAVEARYESQVWEIELPLEGPVSAATDLERAVKNFHSLHERIYAVADSRSQIEFVTWIARVRCDIARRSRAVRMHSTAAPQNFESRNVYFESAGMTATPVWGLMQIQVDELLAGPAIVQSAFTTVIVPPGATFRRSEQDSLLIFPRGGGR